MRQPVRQREGAKVKTLQALVLGLQQLSAAEKQAERETAKAAAQTS
jgi:hypothetical protein